LRAYWRTVGVVMFRQRRFRNEIVRPVDYAAAQRFRWVTILHVAVPVLAALVVVYAGHVAKPFSRTNEVAVVMLRWVWPVGVVYAAFLLFLLAATGMPSYFFHPKAVPVVQQNRAIALSYYASGPLALMALPLLALAAGWVVGFDHLVGMFFLLLGAILPLALMAVWWLDLIHLSFRLLPQRRGRAFLIAIMVPVLWFALGLLFVGGVSAGAAYIWLVFASLP
jgi:hypothetical protein